MPIVRKLAPDEVRGVEDKGKGQRKLTEEQYDRFLADYDVGDYGEAVLDAGENRLTVRNRFKAAAKRRGLALEFRRTGPGFIRFRVMPGNGHATEAPEPEPQPEPEPEPVPTEVPVAPKRRGGRPKKTSA